MTTTVAVIGLGAMGLPMATRLAERFDVRGFDIAADRLALAAESGVAAATSAVDAVSGAQAVLVAVRTGAVSVRVDSRSIAALACGAEACSWP